MTNGTESRHLVNQAHPHILNNYHECREPVHPKIFIVEDELVFADDLKEILEGHGYFVCGSAAKGEEALIMIPEHAPDLVLIDIVLAGNMNGIELARSLRYSIDIPVIYITSNSEDETVASAKCTHPYGYIPKPFDERSLFSTIEIALFKHQVDKQIRESEIRYRTFVENIQGIAYRYDSNHALEFFHGSVEKISGYSVEEFTEGRLAWDDIIHKDDRNTAIFPYKNDGLHALKKRSQEYRIVRKNGEIRWIHDQTQVVHRTPPLFPLFEGVIYDITPLKILETDLKKACDIRTLILLMSGHFFRRFVKNSTQRISTKHKDELISSLSEILEGVGYEMGVHMISLYQGSAAEGDQLQIYEKLRCFHPNHVPPVDVRNISDTPFPQNGFARFKDQLLKGFPIFGTIDQFSTTERQFFPDPAVTSVVMVPVFCEDRFWGFIQGLYFNEYHDWTDYEISSMQVAADVITTIMESGAFQDDSLRLPGLSFLTTPEGASQSPDTLMESAVDMVFVINSGGKILYMNRTGLLFFGMDGKSQADVPCYEAFTSFIKECILPPSVPSLDRHNDRPLELELPAGEKSVFLELTISPVSGSQENRRLFMGIARDTTRQKNLQKKQQMIQKKLQIMQKIVRHDLTNQITAVMGYLYLLKKDTTNPEFLKVIEKGERIVDSIKKSLSFSKTYEHLGDESAIWLDITEVFSAAWASLAPETVQLRLHTTSFEIFVDPLFGNVVFNLLDNSLRHGGKNLSSIQVSLCHTCNETVIVYEDNGSGILAENKEKIFNRGFYVNTGFGLLLSREILSLTGLSIRETGKPGKGACFEITVPAGMWRLSEAET